MLKSLLPTFFIFFKIEARIYKRVFKKQAETFDFGFVISVCLLLKSKIGLEILRGPYFTSFGVNAPSKRTNALPSHFSTKISLIFFSAVTKLTPMR